MRAFILAFAFFAALATPALAQKVDTTPRIAVMSAMEKEIVLLRGATTGAVEHRVGGVVFITGTLEGKPVVLFLSGVSMVNAAMTTQRALDSFQVTAIVFSGIAGGVDPALDVGDVVVSRQWGQYQESAFVREVAGDFPPPPWRQADDAAFGHFGMMYPNSQQVVRPDGQMERRFWFPADPALLATAETIVNGVTLRRCAAPTSCLSGQPRVVVGGNGVSGQTFVDNKAFREWTFASFQAQVLDMETAAVAHVAYANGVPFIGFRSLSDLAGGDAGDNQYPIFATLAAENSATVVRAFLRALPAPAPGGAPG